MVTEASRGRGYRSHTRGSNPSRGCSDELGPVLPRSGLAAVRAKGREPFNSRQFGRTTGRYRFTNSASKQHPRRAM